MFKKTINVTDLKRDINELLGNLCNDEALQVVHRGKAIKVIMTQERYFQLLGLIDQLNIKPVAEDDLVADHPSATRKQRLKKKLERVSDAEKQNSRMLAEKSVNSP